MNRRQTKELEKEMKKMEKVITHKHMFEFVLDGETYTVTKKEEKIRAIVACPNECGN